mgnify:FL=1
MRPREIFQIIAYIDVQIKGIEADESNFVNALDRSPRSPREKIDLEVKKETLEQVKKWIFDKFSE